MTFKFISPLLLAPLLAVGVLSPSTSVVPDAHALSCMRPDVIRTLDKAKKSEDLYYVLEGKFTLPNAGPDAGPTQPQQGRATNQFKPQPPRLTPAVFEGRALTRNPSTDVALSRFPVNIETSCAASWCGTVPPEDTPFIAFVKAELGGTPVLEIGACPEWMTASTAKRVKLVRSCIEDECRFDEDGRPLHGGSSYSK